MSQSVHYEPLDVRQCWGLLFLPPFTSEPAIRGADGVELVLNGRRAFRDYRLRTRRYAVLVAHRRCGKTVACFQGLIRPLDHARPSTRPLCLRGPRCERLDERGYHGTDWMPHDAKVREVGAPGARTRIETLFSLGRKPELAPEQSLMDGINAGRKTIPFARFDAKRCALGLESLRAYRTEWDEKARAFKKTPDHNWASHGADAWRYLSRPGARRCASRRRRRCRSAFLCPT